MLITSRICFDGKKDLQPLSASVTASGQVGSGESARTPSRTDKSWDKIAGIIPQKDSRRGLKMLATVCKLHSTGTSEYLSVGRHAKWGQTRQYGAASP